jgi:hypothetical protein
MEAGDLLDTGYLLIRNLFQIKLMKVNRNLKNILDKEFERNGSS